MKKIAFLILLLLFCYGYFIEPNILKTENIILRTNKMRGENPPAIKFVQLSDLHFSAGTPAARINRIHETIKNLEPALIFITGDIVGEQNGMETAAGLVKKLSADYPVYAIFGNWDEETFRGKIWRLKRKLEEAGAKILLNEKENVFADGNPFTIFGVKNSLTKTGMEKNLRQTLQGVAALNQNYKILLAHSPAIAENVLAQEFDLILTGHTHGGQIYLPWLTKMMIPVKGSAKKFVKGLHQIGKKTMLYVNRGLGASMLPLRFLAPPEITVFQLSPE